MFPVGGRVEIHWIRKLRPLGHVVAQKSLLPGPVVRSLHPRRVAPKDAVALRHLFGRGNDDDRKLNLVVVGHDTNPSRYYQRVGLVNLREHDKRVDNNWLAAYHVEQTRLEPENQLPPLVLEEWNTKTFLSWVEHFRPDAIVARLPEVLLSLRRAGYNVPDDVGVACHTLDEKSRCFSGMKKNSLQIGVMAVDLQIDMLHRNERGIPSRPYLLMVEGSWVEGNTLRKSPEPCAPPIDTHLIGQSTV